MPRIIRTLLLPLVLMFVAAGATAADEPMTLYFRAAITIEADGTLSRVEWDRAGQIPDVLRERLEARVRDWRYVPGTVDGQPARTESSLWLRARAEPRGQGFVVEVEDASTGPRMAQVVPPDYPREALRRGAEASVLVLVHVAADGTRDVEIANYAGDKRNRPKFEDAIRASLRGVEVVQELVNGHPAPATLRIPFEFCTASGPLQPCRPHAWPELQAAGTAALAPSGEPVPASSVASIATEVRGTSI